MGIVSYAWDDSFEFLVTVVEMGHTRMSSSHRSAERLNR